MSEIGMLRQAPTLALAEQHAQPASILSGPPKTGSDADLTVKPSSVQDAGRASGLGSRWLKFLEVS
jgi:hypothetical protein